MSLLLLKQDAINVDIEPTTFRASSPSVFGGKAGNLSLEVDREGFRLINKKGNAISTVAWYELEELKNEIRDKGQFLYLGTVFTGGVDVKTRVRIGVEPDERERLAEIFDKLPQDVFGRKCPDCGGSVVDNVCKNCGQSFSGQQRRKGMKMTMIGSIVFVLGILLTYATYSPSSGSVWVFYGAILIGAGWVIAGLIALMFGKRV
jgi:hypothetical protein